MTTWLPTTSLDTRAYETDVFRRDLIQLFDPSRSIVRDANRFLLVLEGTQTKNPQIVAERLCNAVNVYILRMSPYHGQQLLNSCWFTPLLANHQVIQIYSTILMSKLMSKLLYSTKLIH